MDELAELKRRVDSAVDHLAAAQNARRQQQDSLIQLLADLEVKFDARHEELAYCHSRISGLEKANGQLTELLNTVVHLIESGSVEDPNDPIFRASQMAAELVRLCASKPVALAGPVRDDTTPADMLTVEAEEIDAYPSVRRPAAGAASLQQPAETPPPAFVEEPDEAPAAERRAPMPPDEPAPADFAPEAGGFPHHFDEVSTDELDVESLLDDMPEGDATPAPLAKAMVAAIGGAAEENFLDWRAEASPALDAAQPPADAGDRPLDDPGIDTVVDFEVVDMDEITTPDAGDGGAAAEPGGDDEDIKVLMARIQEAAEKARSRSDAREVASSNRTPPPHDRTGTS